MTTKEKIVCLLNTYEAYAHTYCDVDKIIKFNYSSCNWDVYKDDLEEVKEIIKDIEILEILKENLYTLDEDICMTRIFVSEKENKLIKEWLKS